MTEFGDSIHLHRERDQPRLRRRRQHRHPPRPGSRRRLRPAAEQRHDRRSRVPDGAGRSSAARPDAAALCAKAYYYAEPDVIYSTGGSVNLWTRDREADRPRRSGPRPVRPRRRAATTPTASACSSRARRSRPSACSMRTTSPTGKRPTGAFAPARRGCAATTSRARTSGTRPPASSRPTNQYNFLFRRNALMFVRKRGTPLQSLTALLNAHLLLRPALFPDATRRRSPARPPN